MSTKKLQIIGNFGGNSIEIDDTLTRIGHAADAKATGDAINQLQANVDNVANIVNNLDDTHYTESEIDSMMADLNATIDTKSDSNHIHDTLYYTETEIDAKLGAMQSDLDSKVDAVDGKGLSTNDYTDEEQQKLRDIESGANYYEHPAHSSHDSGLYKVTVDDEGHVSETSLVEKEDIIAFVEKDDILALGIPDKDVIDEEISDLSDRIDDVENSINTTNETLNDLSQEFGNYKETNNEAVSTNTSGIEANKTAIEEIQGDYLTSTDKTQIQDDITKVSEKATANASAIEILNGEGNGSVKQSIDNAFNEFAANVTNDDVVNTYKELIDYAAKHGPEFTELVGKVDTIGTHVSEIETDISNYKTAVSDQFTEVDTTINNHVTDTNNPHGVTKEQIGLDVVDNTSDMDKPVSHAMQEALDEKADLDHDHNGLYYTKDEIVESITVEDIDNICEFDVGNDTYGISPTAAVTQVEGGAIVTITDKNGTTTAIIRHGQKGDKGDTIDTSAIESKLAVKGDNLEFDYDTNLLYLTSEGERIGDGIQVATGVGGGGNTSLEYTITLKNLLESRVLTVAAGNKVELKYTYSSVDSDGYTDGNGVGRLTINGAVKPALSVVQGENTLDVTSMLSVGVNTIKIRVENSEGTAKTLPYTVNVVAATITSSFDVSAPFTGDIQFDYTPNGAVEKTVYFEVDGTVIGNQVVTASGKQQSYIIPAKAHGSHTLRVWFECVIEGTDVTSNELYYEFASIVAGNTTPIITSNFKAVDVTQYDTVVVAYRVFAPNGLTSTIDLIADNIVVGDDLVVDRTEQYWSYRVDNAGSHTLKIQCGSIYKSWTFNAVDANVDVEAETNNLSLYLSSYGRNNNEANPATWEYGDIKSTFSNFNFASDGWQIDEDGVTVLRVAGDARLTIPAKIFAQNARTTGKTIEIEFASRDVLDYDAVIISCMSEGNGIQITSQRADLFSTQSEIGTQYKENEHIRVSFVIEKQSDNRFLLVYINGILSGAEVYPEDDNFSQFNAVGISIGSNLCTTDIYCIRVYDNNLNRYQILDNWIADTQNGALMIERYNRNQVYNKETDEVTIDNLPADLPYLVIEAAALPADKEDDQKTCSGYYVDLMNPNKSFTFDGASIKVQGTSSQYYYVKNYKIKFKNGFKNNGVVSETYQLNNKVIGTNEFTFKADVASSEGANNVVLAQLYNDLCPSLTPPQMKDSRVRQTIDGHPIVIFWNNGTEVKFLGKYNFNNDKGTAEVFGFADGDESWEIRQNGTDLVGWKSDDFSGDWGNDFEARYPEDNTDITNLKALSTWLVSTNTEAATNAALSSAVTYNGVQYTTDSAEYRLAKFRAELPDHADVNALVFYYLFTEIFLCIDQREKNAFPTLFAEAGRWLMFFYDADSSLGIDNKGKLAFDYYLEDIDYTEGGDPVYNGQGSVLWVNMRKAYYAEIAAMYKEFREKLRSDNSGDTMISYDVVNRAFETHQSKWCEAIFNEDMYRKCLEPMIVAGDGQYLPMLLGKKEMHRKWWLYNRFRFLDSKYITGSSMETRIMIRAKSKANVWLTPYVNMYGHVYYNDEHVEHRMERGTAYEYVWAATGAEDAVIGINDADMITSLGDLSALQVETIDIAKAKHLTSLKIGDASSSYSNKNLTSVTLGNNTLLRSLDLRNCVSLNTSIGASGCANIEEIYCEGTSITGISLPNGGILKTLHLPATVTNLVVLNQQNITDFSMAGYDSLEVLRVENSDGVPTERIVRGATNLKRVRLLNVDWTITDATVLERLDACGGRDENNNDTTRPVITGKAIVDAPVAANMIDYWRNAFPDLELTFNVLGYTVTFKDWDGTVLKSQDVISGGSANPPSAPSRESTAQYDYTFNGWDNSYQNITSDTVCTAIYSESIRKYTVRFYDGTTLKQTKQIPYGSGAVYTGNSLTKAHDNPDLYYWIMSGWYPYVSNVTKDIDTYAQWEEKAYPVFQTITPPNSTHKYLHIAGDMMFAVDSTSYPDSTDIYYTSKDMVNWEAHTVPDLMYTANPTKIGYANGLYFLLHKSSSNVYSDRNLIYSTDGVNWVASVASFGIYTGENDIIWDGTHYIVLTDEGIWVFNADLSEMLIHYETTQYGSSGKLMFDEDSNRLYIFVYNHGFYYSDVKNGDDYTYLDNITDVTLSSSYNMKYPVVKNGEVYCWNTSGAYNPTDSYSSKNQTLKVTKITPEYGSDIITYNTSNRIPVLSSNNIHSPLALYKPADTIISGAVSHKTEYGDTNFTLFATKDGSSFVGKQYAEIDSPYLYFFVTEKHIIISTGSSWYYAINTL